MLPLIPVHGVPDVEVLLVFQLDSLTHPSLLEYPFIPIQPLPCIPENDRAGVVGKIPLKARWDSLWPPLTGQWWSVVKHHWWRFLFAYTLFCRNMQPYLPSYCGWPLKSYNVHVSALATDMIGHRNLYPVASRVLRTLCFTLTWLLLLTLWQREHTIMPMFLYEWVWNGFGSML